MESHLGQIPVLALWDRPDAPTEQSIYWVGGVLFPDVSPAKDATA